MSIALPSLRLNRIERVLDHIHANLDMPLSVEEIAAHSCWSRWQLQRVFASATGLNVAQYIRELRLSKAAQMLLDTNRRQLDIALACGMDSEISFSRSFRQMFGCSPGSYRKRAVRTGLRIPIRTDVPVLPPQALSNPLLQIHVENRPAFQAYGITTEVGGLFADEPDFVSKVPALWIELKQQLSGHIQQPCPHMGILDIGNASASHRFDYCATVLDGTLPSQTLIQQGLQLVQIPEQLYAVIPFTGPLNALADTLLWFILYWLPDSGYKGENGFDLEFYDENFRLSDSEVSMQYWVPISIVR